MFAWPMQDAGLMQAFASRSSLTILSPINAAFLASPPQVLAVVSWHGCGLKCCISSMPFKPALTIQRHSVSRMLLASALNGSAIYI